jgi:Mg/Co/Ni transporter MgtE
VVSIRAREDQEEAVRIMEVHDLTVLPVVGRDGVLLGVVTVEDILDVIAEEATAGLHSLGAVGQGPAPGLRSGLREATFGIGIWRGGFELAWNVSLTMVGTVTFGSLVGLSLPFALERFNFDPATASAPLITSIADIGGVLIYFSIATWWLGL